MKIITKLICGSAAFVSALLSAHSQETGANTTSALQISTGDCLVAKQTMDDANTKGALDAIAGAVISQGVNYIGKALTAAGAAKTWTMAGARNIQADSTNFAKCILVVRGRFNTSGGVIGSWTVPNGWPSDLGKKLATKGVHLADAPDFIFEGQVIASSDKSALAIRPIIASYANPIGTRFLRWGTDRNIALFFAITPPGTKPTIETSPAATVILGRFAAATTHFYESSAAYTSPYESSWFTLAKADTVKPFTVTVLLSETQDEQQFLTFLGSVLSDPKVTAAATTQIAQSLGTSAGQQASQDTASKAAAAANDADTKLALAIVKLTTCKAAADGTSALTSGAEARNALRNYMMADSLLSSPSRVIDVGVIEKIDLQKGKNAIVDACISVLASLNKP